MSDEYSNWQAAGRAVTFLLLLAMGWVIVGLIAKVCAWLFQFGWGMI